MSRRPVINSNSGITQQLSDAELLSICQRSHSSPQNINAQKAYRELLQRYSGLVYHFAYQMTQQSELSEEITQDTFLKVHQNLHRFDAQRPFKPWLMRIASNTAISALRKLQNKSAVSMDALAEQGFQLSDIEPSVNQASAVEEQEQAEFSKKRVEAALANMDEKYKQVLILRYMQEFSYDDIAQSLGIPLNTVRTWLRRGLDQFKKQVAEQQVVIHSN